MPDSKCCKSQHTNTCNHSEECSQTENIANVPTKCSQVVVPKFPKTKTDISSSGRKKLSWSARNGRPLQDGYQHSIRVAKHAFCCRIMWPVAFGALGMGVGRVFSLLSRALFMPGKIFRFGFGSFLCLTIRSGETLKMTWLKMGGFLGLANTSGDSNLFSGYIGPRSKDFWGVARR